MFEVYAADVQFHADRALRERALGRRAQRTERTQRMARERDVRAIARPRLPRARTAGAWPRPIALHA